MNNYDESYYQEVVKYYSWINNSMTLNERWNEWKRSKNLSKRTSTKP